MSKLQLRHKFLAQVFSCRYLDPFKPAKGIDGFFKSISRVEIRGMLDALHHAGFAASSSIDDDSFVPPASINLAVAPIPLTFNCLANVNFTRNRRLVDIIASGLPLSKPLPLPPIVLPGLVNLLFNPNQLLREFARLQLDGCQLISPEHYKETQIDLMVSSYLSKLAEKDGAGSAGTEEVPQHVQTNREFWQAIAAMLQVISPDVIRSHLLLPGPLNIVFLVAGHLGDVGDHLEFVLASFRTLLISLGSQFWSAGGKGYAEVVLHSVLDNRAFEAAFILVSSSSTDQPLFDWLPPFLSSVAHSTELFPTSLAIVATTFLDRFQKDRFEVAPRTIALELTLNVFTEILLSSRPSYENILGSPPPISWPHAHHAVKVLELHATFLAQLAFSREYSHESYRRASEAALSFIGNITGKDTTALVDNVYALGRFEVDLKTMERKKAAEEKAAKKARDSGKPVPPPSTLVVTPPTLPPTLTIVQALWDRTYDLIRPTDNRAIGILLRSVSRSCHLEKITSKTWSIKTVARQQMQAANLAMDTSRDRLIPLINILVEDRTEHLIEFLSLPGMAECIVLLLLSPVEAIHNTAQALVKEAFDITTRRDCFRSLLLLFPDATLKGIIQGIRAFTRCSAVLPEACGMAKRVVRCLSDVIDVLGGATDGLLRDTTFLASSDSAGVRQRLASFWKLMCNALAVLFRRTPDWANYFENDEMTEWMRDAVLFGEDMLVNVRTFEMVASGQMISSTAGSPTKTSSIGQSMITALNEPLEELIAWLRLNDEDLLTSSFNLVKLMVDRFTRSGIRIRSSTVVKLKKATAKTERKDGTTASSCALRDDQLGELQDSLEAHEGYDDSGADTDPEKVSRSRKPAKSHIETIEILDDDDQHSNQLRKVPKALNRLAPVFSSSSMPKLPFGTSTKSLLNVTSRPPTNAFSKPLTAKGPNFSVPAMRNAARPRGVPWTTYSSKPAVESSSDESEDDSAEKGKLSGLALLARAQGSPKMKKAIERRSVMLFEGKGAAIETRGGNFGKSAAAQHAANSARLRGVQDFSGLHRQVLQWDCEYDGNLPPNMKTKPDRIPSSFASADAYFAAFEPLLLIECWEQIRQAKKEMSSSSDLEIVPCDVAGRQAVDDFTDVFLTVEHGKMPNRMWFNASDVVLLRQGKRQTLAKVQSFGKKRSFFEITLRCHLGSDVTAASASLVARTQWEIVKMYT